MSDLKVTTYSSKGRATRIKSNKSENILHLQSDLQLKVLLLLEFRDEIERIESNVLLNDLLEDTDLSNLKLNKYSKDNGEIYDFYINFLVITRSKQIIAIEVKYLEHLERNNTIERLEILRRYFSKKKIMFLVITEKEVDETMVQNLMKLRK